MLSLTRRSSDLCCAFRDYLLRWNPKDIDVFINVDGFTNPGGFETLGSGKAAEYDAMNEIAVVTRGVIAGYQVDLIGVTFADTHDMVERDRKSTRLNSSH